MIGGADREVAGFAAGADGAGAGDHYLERVAARLRMPADAERDVIDELRAHLDDARAALEAEGLDPDKAEREAMARLGSPDALGDDLRRTHHTRRRLIAAAGGGVWDGLKDAITGYIVGIIVVLIVFMGLGTLAQRLLGPASLNAFGGRGVETAYSGALFSIAAWWGARGLVRSMARRSLRRTAALRAPIALAGALPLTVLLLVWPLHYNWGGIAAMLALPVSWAVAALTTPEPGRRSRWSFGRPSPRLLGGGAIAVFVVPLALYLISPVTTVTTNQSWAADDVLARMPDQEHWVALGYNVVAPTVVDLQRSRWTSTPFPDRNGNVALSLDNDTIDWDELADLRAEAWAALPSNRWVETLDPRAVGPYAVVPLQPWAATAAIVSVGAKPGIDAYLVFVTGVDRATGKRVAIGYPEGEEVAFTGTIVDWFAWLGP
ncbi:MAG TPA: permease prefix domain 1-containing protein [Candidatus Limnocylindrales bacterium]|nr:permease prefix domain 1-containing protein [Candidatus Limnocylindrales bacterium]